jgi:hypothetical protein
MKSISPVTFIDKLIKKNELGQPFTLIVMNGMHPCG